MKAQAEKRKKIRRKSKDEKMAKKVFLKPSVKKLLEYQKEYQKIPTNREKMNSRMRKKRKENPENLKHLIKT